MFAGKRTVLASTAIVVLLVGRASLLEAQLPAGAVEEVPPANRRVRESVSLDVDNVVIKQLRTVRAHFAERQWDQAFEIIRQISTTGGDQLVPVSPGRYLNVRTYVDLLLARLDAEGLALFRKTIDPQAQQWFEMGRRNHDEGQLERLVGRAFVSSKTDEALDLLGRWAWERGDLSLARRYWLQILPFATAGAADEAALVLRYPDTNLDRAAILARLVLCSIVEGDHRRARREHAAFGKLHPHATGMLAGRSGNLAETLRAVITEAKDWEFARAEVTAQTFALNRERNQVLPHAVDVGAIRWSVPLPQTPLPVHQRHQAFNDPGPLSYYPVVWGDVVLVNDAERVFAWNLESGEPAWSSGEKGDALIFPLAGGLPAPRPSRPAVGVPRFTMTVDDGRLFAKLGTPVTSRAPREHSSLPSDLVCLDLARDQGKLKWPRVSAQPLLTGWSFEGTPVVRDDRFYVALRRSPPQIESRVACYEADTGKEIWNRKVFAGVGEIDEGVNSISHHLLTLAEKRIFYSTDMGAVAALDARDGALLWVVTYDRREKPSAEVLSDHTKWGLTPCLFHQGTVVVAPNDLDGVMAIDALSGIVLWRRQLRGGIRHLLAVRDGMLILSGDRLWGLNLQDPDRGGWQIGFDDPAAHGYGRGLVAENLVYWPTRDEIFIVDYATGRIVRRVALAALHGVRSGHLLIANGMLLVAQPNRLVAFGQYAGRRQPLQRDISSRRFPARWGANRSFAATSPAVP
jgi:outer membrane protein assembly factor BamB